MDGIIALSDNCKKYIVKRFNGLIPEKVTVIYNSVAALSEATEIRSSKLHNRIISIVFAGGTAPSKSPEIVIDVLKKLCETDLPFKFYWLGNITPPLKKIQPYSDIRAILPDDNRIKITGRIPQHEASNIIANCNIFLAPSKREGFPMALLEAMRIGCIPIISDFDIANKEVITDGKNGFVIKRNDINGFVNLIKDVIENHEKYYDIYNNTYLYFTENLSFNIWYKKIRSVVEGIRDSHKRRLKISRIRFLSSLFRFRFLDKYNLIENHFKEVIPCAYSFWTLYKSNKQCQ